MANEAVAPTRQKGGLGKTLRDIVIVSALLAGGTYLYYANVTTREAVNKMVVDAQSSLEKDDLPALKRAEGKFNEALQLDADSPDALAGLAEVYFYMWQHGEDTKAKAEEYLGRAKAEAPEKPGVMAVDAYLKIVAGQSSQVAGEIKTLLEQGVYHPKLAHAYGWALMEQGQYDEAIRAVRQGLDTRFSAIRFSNTMAEIFHRKGDERGAIRQLSKSLSTSMNPEHEIALGWAAALRAKNYGNLSKPAKAITDLNKKKDSLGPIAKGYMLWAEAELIMSFGNPGGAIAKLDEAKKILPDYPPLDESRGRAYRLAGKKKDSYAALEAAVAAKPEYLGNKWTLATFKSRDKNDEALALLGELEARIPEKDRGPEFEIFRGEHYLRKGELDKAKTHFTKAAELGDKAEILLGLANVTFKEEQAKGKKADLARVSEAFTEVYNKKSTLPELHEALAKIELWNYNAEGAAKSFGEAEANYKKMRRPVTELVRFYDRTSRTFKRADGPKALKKKTKKLAEEWTRKKQVYLQGVASLN